MTPTRSVRIDAAIAAVLLVVGVLISGAAMREFRRAGMQPSFYQGNFEPAVMMACGHGFVTTTFQASPASLRDFLQLKRNDFHCADLPANLPLVQVTWNGTWYYLYGTAALIWKVTGLSWTALDGLVAVMGGVTTAALYALFRLVAWPWLSAAMSLLLTLAPAHRSYLLYLRDYSKAPLVLVATFILGLLIIRPMTRAQTIATAALFGVVVGFGYGFRTDLMIMLPFGAIVVALLLPGSLRLHAARNGLAVAALVISFLIFAWLPLRGLRTGGCQFHYSLLGLTSPLTKELGVEPAPYNFGDRFTDTFIDLKVGDWAQRQLGLAPPNLCDPNYDIASGQLFKSLALTFPADLVTRAIGSVLMILHAGFQVPALDAPALPYPLSSVAARTVGLVNRVLPVINALGPVITLVAVFLAWTISTRVGIALTAFVLFLCGYPAIEFEARHWFHLRFIPWWAAAFVLSQIVQRRASDWPRDRLWRAAAGVAAVCLALGGTLAVLRAVQSQSVRALIASYEKAPTEDLPVRRGDESFLAVDWQPVDYAAPPAHRSSDLMVLSLDASQCRAAAGVRLAIHYDTDAPSHDLTSTMTIPRAQLEQPAPHVYVPIFAQGHLDHSYMRFAGVEVIDGAAACISRVARVVDRHVLPVWLELRAPAVDGERLYQRVRNPSWLR